MQIELERYTRTVKFIYPLLWVQPPGHTNLEYMVSERTKVTDNTIDVTRLTILKFGNLFLFFLDLSKLGIQLLQLYHDISSLRGIPRDRFIVLLRLGRFLMHEQGFASDWAETAGMPFAERIMKIKSIFKVSYKTVLYRLKQKGIVDDRIWLRFQQLYEAKYNKKLSFKEEPFPEGSVPFGLKSFDFYADRLSRLVRRTVEEEKISISRAAEILNLSSEQMMERIAEWDDFG